MKKIMKNIDELPKKKKIQVVIASSLTAFFAVSIPVLAWFSTERKLGDLQRVDAPTELYITAPHGDNIKYLRPDDIKVSSGTSSYYAFCVSGSEADYYSLQLAFTTNNQFEYFIYPAKEISLNEQGEPLESYIAKHTVHGEDGKLGTTYYYAIDKSVIQPPDDADTNLDESYRLQTNAVIRGEPESIINKITTKYLNKIDGKIKANSNLHDDTYNYSTYNGSGTQIYAEPIYWQALHIKSGMQSNKKIEDYYILEINWAEAAANAAANGEELKDDRETDIIYIAVEASS